MKKNKIVWQLPFLVLLIVGTVVIIRHQSSIPYQHNSGMVFGTTYNITYQCDSNLHNSIIRELEKVDEALSPFNKKSVITTINGNGNDGRTDASEYYTFSEDKVLDVDEILDNLIVIVCPDENPDGRTYNTRPNGNGFDLNRDASNQTQVETQNISKLISPVAPLH